MPLSRALASADTGMRIAALVALLTCVVLSSDRADAFSVLAHQAVVDRSWDEVIEPALRGRFPTAGPEDMRRARAFAVTAPSTPERLRS